MKMLNKEKREQNKVVFKSVLEEIKVTRKLGNMILLPGIGLIDPESDFWRKTNNQSK